MLARLSPLYSLFLIGVVAAGALTGPLLDARQDDAAPSPDANALGAPQIQLLGPDFHNNTDQKFPTCSVVKLRWLYSPGITDSFNAYITSANAPVIAPTTTGSGTITSPSFSITSATGSVSPPAVPSSPGVTPSRRRFLRRAPGDITLQVITSQPAVVDFREVLWKVQVPAGWYKLTGASTTTNTETVVSDSTAFEITAGDTACFNDGSNPTTSAGSNQPGQTAIVPGTGGASNKTGVIAGAVVGSLVGVAAIFGLFFICVLRRKTARNQSSRQADAWGSVDSKDSRFRGVTGLPPGTPNRLSRNAEAMVAGRDLERDSFEEKGSGSSSGGHSANFSPEPPVFRRHSQSSQAMVLGPLSTRDSRRSTLQSIPTNVTPTNATPIPSPYPHSDGHASTETAVASLATTAAATTTRSNSVAKKPTRKPVPTYRPDSAQTPSKRNSEEDIPEADLGAQMISHSQRSDTVLLNAFPFEMEGAREVHYLIPDPPAPPRR